MNELKPEDVMRALEICARPSAISQTAKCKNCPYWERDCHIEFIPDVLALLREKDAEIKGLVDGWSKDQDCFEKVCAEKDAEIERLEQANKNLVREVKAAHIRINDLERDKKMYHQAFETAQKEFIDYQADVNMEIADARAEAIDEFAERLYPLYKVLCVDESDWRNEVDKIAKELKGGTPNA